MAEQQGGAFDSRLKKKVGLSLAWTVLRSVSDQLFSFIIFVILAHLLTKAEVGLFALAFVVSEVGRMVATSGVTELVARIRNDDQPVLNAVFWSNLILAGIYTAIVFVAAEVIARGLAHPELANVLRVLCLTVVMNAFGATHLALRLREFGHKTVALRSLLAGVLGGGVALAAAYAGFGVWSLVFQRLAFETVNLVLSWTSYKWVPSLELDFAEVRRKLAFTGNVTIAQLIFFFVARIQDLLIGAHLGAAAVGVYRVAWRCPEVLSVGSIQPFSTVAIQTFATLSDDSEALRHSYRALIRACSAVCFPALVGFGCLAPQLIPLIFGAKWTAAGDIAQVFALLTVPMTLNYFASPILASRGNSSSQRTLALIQLTLTVAITAVTLRWGLYAVAVGYIFRAYLTLPVQMLLTRRAAGVQPRDSWRAIEGPFLASAAMGIALLVIEHVLGRSGIPFLALEIAVGALIYVGVLLAVSPEIARMAMGLLRSEPWFEGVKRK